MSGIDEVKWLPVLALAGLSVMLAGCPSVGTQSTTPTATAASNSASSGSSGSSGTLTPTTTKATTLGLAGTPATTATAGQAYNFQPSVNGATGTSVTFKVANLPIWASFSTTTGAVSGTPSASQTGTYANITITASSGGSSTSLTPFTVNVIAAGAGSAALSWAAPTINTDGSILSDLAGYHIYYGTSATALSQEINVTGAANTSDTVNGLNPGTYYFAVTAYSSQGTESMPTPTVSKTI